MDLFDIELAIATKYNHICVFVTNNGSCTYLSLSVNEGVSDPIGTITLGLLRSTEHFIAMLMSEDSQLPRLMPAWKLLKDCTVKGWDERYETRFDKWCSEYNFLAK